MLYIWKKDRIFSCMCFVNFLNNLIKYHQNTAIIPSTNGNNVQAFSSLFFELALGVMCEKYGLAVCSILIHRLYERHAYLFIFFFFIAINIHTIKRWWFQINSHIFLKPVNIMNLKNPCENSCFFFSLFFFTFFWSIRKQHQQQPKQLLNLS